MLDKIKLGRLGQVEDLMGAIVFLASDAVGADDRRVADRGRRLDGGIADVIAREGGQSFAPDDFLDAPAARGMTNLRPGANTAGLMQFGGCLPSAIAAILSTTTCAMFSRNSITALPRCGVSTTLFMVSSARSIFGSFS